MAHRSAGAPLLDRRYAPSPVSTLPAAPLSGRTDTPIRYGKRTLRVLWRRRPDRQCEPPRVHVHTLATVPRRSLPNREHLARPLPPPFGRGVRWPNPTDEAPRRDHTTPPPLRLTRPRHRPSQDKPSDTKLLQRFKVRVWPLGPHARTNARWTPPLSASLCTGDRRGPQALLRATTDARSPSLNRRQS